MLLHGDSIKALAEEFTSIVRNIEREIVIVILMMLLNANIRVDIEH